jgi:hypothetical protein
MKKIVTLVATLLLLVSFSACGGGSDSSAKAQVVESMVLDGNYTLAIGDKINRLTDDAEIQITQNSKDNEAVYTLVAGEAEIVRK